MNSPDRRNLKIPDDKEEKLFIWKKWWDELPYKLIRINRYDFLGDRHLECES